MLTPAAMPRPDGHYGLSKAFGENLAQFYWDRYGLETVSLRIGSSFPEPKDRRMLATWLSYDDLERLVVAALAAPVVGHTVMYGMSDNAVAWWDNTPRATSATGRRTAPSPSAPPPRRASRASTCATRPPSARAAPSCATAPSSEFSVAHTQDPKETTMTCPFVRAGRAAGHSPSPRTPPSSAGPTSTRRLPTVLAVRHMRRDAGQEQRRQAQHQVFAKSALGNEKDTIEQTKLGALAMTRVNVAPMNNICPATMVPTMPFLFPAPSTCARCWTAHRRGDP